MPYIVVPPENGLCALAQAPSLSRCEGCDAPIAKRRQPFDLRQRPANAYALSETQDGFLTASQAFYKRYFAEGWFGLSFRPLANGHYLVIADREVRLLRHDVFAVGRSELAPYPKAPEPSDATGYVIHHTTPCQICGRYQDSYGQGPAIIARGEVPIGSKEFVAGDFELGRGDGKAPFLLVGDDLHAAHLRRRIPSLTIQASVSYEPWSTPSLGYQHEGQILQFPVPN